MALADDTLPQAPVGRVAPGTHPLELQRLALQERVQQGCDPLSVQALIWLFRAYSAANSAHVEELRPLGLSPSAFNVLMALHNTPGGTLEPCQLAARLLVSRPSVTGLLDTLQGKGLVRRTPHADDRRRVLVRLTAEGRRTLERHFTEHSRHQVDVFADLTPDEQATLVILLRRVRGATPAHLRDE